MSAVPPAPAGTAELFGHRWPAVQAYAELLCTKGVVAGVIGPREVARIWERHIRNSLAVTPFLDRGTSVIDLGSGAGLPGIPVALARPDLRVTLLDSMARRVRFLRLAVETSGAPCSIEHSRAESAVVRGSAVICRAVAPAAQLLPWAHHLCRGAGTLIALKGRNAQDEVADVEAALRTRPVPAWAPRRYELVQVEWPDPAVVFLADWQQALGRTDGAGRPRARRNDGGLET
jgi:16S rRNA (guanine527-N7)-methyltransferase